MHPLERISSRFIQDTDLVKPGDRILLAVSGGADSIALLLFFQLYLQNKFNLSLAVGHLNHALRGKASDGDQVFVEKLCTRFDIPYFSEKKAIKPAKHESLEETARKVRYIFLEQTAKQHGFTKIATAHHLDDQTETLLMRLLTGTGLSGLAGIRPKNKNIIRPFLTVSKQEILDYLKTKRQPFRTDKSNWNNSFLRNKIRHQLIPFLTSRFGAHIPKALSRFALQAGEDMALSEEKCQQLLAPLVLEKTEKSIQLKAKPLLILPRYLAKQLLETAISDFTKPIKLGSAHINAIFKLLSTLRSADLNLPGNLIIQKSQDTLTLRTAKPVCRQYLHTFLKRVGGHRNPFSEKPIILTRLPNSSGTVFPKENEYRAYFDYDKLPRSITIRSRKQGDRFHPLGAPGSMKLKEFLINKKVSLPERDQIPLLCTGREVIWVAGYRISDRWKVKPETKRIAIIALGG